ncbi:DUF6747 family protein [Aurantibacter sp.]|uniref:DUF6747 family protein n=1 Tax=Aurantibacter sp. TaxID=2807103 RepID=UPI003266AED8
MKTTLLIKEIYLQAFRNFSNYVIKNYLKVLTWFTFFLIIVGMYALIFRISTGFAFD